MKTIQIVFVLTLVVLASANPRPGPTIDEQSDASDADLGRAVIECARKALITGIPEVGILSYDPYNIATMYAGSFVMIFELMSGGYSIHDIVIEGIPFWDVTQFDELSSDDGVDVFNYTIHWEKVVFKANWNYHLRVLGVETENEGAVTVELDDVSISGTFEFTKPGPGRTETINDLDLHITSQGGQIDFTNLGALGDKIHDDSVGIISDKLNQLDIAALSEDFKNIIINDWIQRPDRIEAIITRCQK